jgi:hypothetical protein
MSAIYHEWIIGMLSRATCLIATLISAGSALSSCHGDVIVEVQDVTLAAGGSGFVDVLISSDAADAVESFFLSLVITDPNSHAVNGALEFDIEANQPNISTDASYVLFGDSFSYTVDRDYDVDPLTLSVDDFSVSGTGTVLSATKKLLARVAITHTLIGAASNAWGNSFTIGDDSLTAFYDDLGNPLTISGSSTLSGTVYIATPEPSSLLLLGAGAMGFVYRIRQRRLSQRLADAT